jgi:DNA-binding PadR family transcriptional regulator
MTPRRRRSNPLALAVLSCLYERPMHPYEVSQTLRARAKQDSIRLNFGSLYGVVDSLAAGGMIEPVETIREGRRPERTVYAITDDGSRELIEWLSELLSVPEKEYLHFEAALSLLGTLPPEEVADLLTQRVAALEVRLAEMRGRMETARAMKLPRLFMLEEEYMRQLLETERDWTRTLVEEIRSGELDGVEEWKAWHADPDRATWPGLDEERDS